MSDDSDYYPSCVVNLTLRYDEALRVAETPEDFTIANKRAEDVQAKPNSIAGSRVSEDSSAKRRRARVPNYSAVLAGRIAKLKRGLSTSSDPLSTIENLGIQGQILALQQEKAALDRQVGTLPAMQVAHVKQATAIAEGVGGAVLIPISFGSDGFTVFSSRVPVRGSFQQGHPREAAKFTLSFDYREFPVDPRLLRAVGVEIHLGCVTAKDYARGMGGERDASGRPLSILKTRLDSLDPITGQPAVDPSTLLFYGTADTWKVTNSSEQGSMITLEGRDTRGIFLDAKVSYARVQKVDLRKPIHVVVADLIGTISSEHDLKVDVVTDAAEWPNGRIIGAATLGFGADSVIPSPGDVAGMTRVRSGAAGEQPKSTPQNAQGSGGSGDKSSYWDLITNYCALVGAIPYFDGTTLRIRPARRIFDIRDDPSIPTPFAGGQPRVVGEETIRIRRFVWGRNLKDLEFDRKFHGSVVPTIKCVSIDDRKRGMSRFLQAQWPPLTSPTAKAKAETEELTIPIPGVRDVKRLESIAHDIYEEVGRGETGGTAKTTHCASLGGGNSDPDVLRMRATEPVEFLIDARALSATSPVVSELNDAARRTFEEEVSVVYQRLGDLDLARAIVASARNSIPELLSYYQVTRVTYEWGPNGVDTTFEFQNYVVSRHGESAADRARGAADIQRQRVEVVGQQRKKAVQNAFALADTITTRFGGDTSASAPRPKSQKQAIRLDQAKQKQGVQSVARSRHLGGGTF